MENYGVKIQNFLKEVMAKETSFLKVSFPHRISAKNGRTDGQADRRMNETEHL